MVTLKNAFKQYKLYGIVCQPIRQHFLEQWSSFARPATKPAQHRVTAFIKTMPPYCYNKDNAGQLQN